MSAQGAKLVSEQRVLYARQISLAEIGEAGQQALCGLSVHVPRPSGVQEGAAQLLALYLERAGLSLRAPSGTPGVVEGQALACEPRLPSPSALAQLAGRPELELAASYLCATFEAVETLKAALSIGESTTLPASLVLSTQPVGRDHTP